MEEKLRQQIAELSDRAKQLWAAGELDAAWLVAEAADQAEKRLARWQGVA